MGLNAKNAAGGGGFKSDPLEAGTYPAYLIQVVDLGLQPQPPYKGVEKDPVQKVMVTYELADEFLKDEDDQEMPDKPRWISEIFGLHNLNSEKAKSTERYLALDPNKDKDGDWSQLVTTPCFVTLVQNERNGKVYENVASVAPMRDKDAKRFNGPVNEPRIFDLDNPDLEQYLALPKFVQKFVQDNLNYKGSKMEALLKDGGEPAKEEKPARATTEEVDEDENPY